MTTKENIEDAWKTCIPIQKMPSNPYKVVCMEPTTAKYIRISVAGKDIPLQLSEVEVWGSNKAGEFIQFLPYHLYRESQNKSLTFDVRIKHLYV